MHDKRPPGLQYISVTPDPGGGGGEDNDVGDGEEGSGRGPKTPIGFVASYSAKRKQHESATKLLEKEKHRVVGYTASLAAAKTALDHLCANNGRSCADLLVYACAVQRLSAAGVFEPMQKRRIQMVNVRFICY